MRGVARKSSGPLIVVALALAANGCGGADVEDYIPADEVARSALKAALDGWQTGSQPAPAEGLAKSIELQDSAHRDGRKLKSYEIVGPSPGDDQNRRYKVKLLFDGEESPSEAIYVIVGKDPLWVFNDRDFQKAGGM
jgi:hypothetical protein